MSEISPDLSQYRRYIPGPTRETLCRLSHVSSECSLLLTLNITCRIGTPGEMIHEYTARHDWIVDSDYHFAIGIGLYALDGASEADRRLSVKCPRAECTRWKPAR